MLQDASWCSTGATPLKRSLTLFRTPAPLLMTSQQHTGIQDARCSDNLYAAEPAAAALCHDRNAPPPVVAHTSGDQHHTVLPQPMRSYTPALPRSCCRTAGHLEQHISCTGHSRTHVAAVDFTLLVAKHGPGACQWGLQTHRPLWAAPTAAAGPRRITVRSHWAPDTRMKGSTLWVTGGTGPSCMQPTPSASTSSRPARRAGRHTDRHTHHTHAATHPADSFSHACTRARSDTIIRTCSCWVFSVRRVGRGHATRLLWFGREGEGVSPPRPARHTGKLCTSDPQGRGPSEPAATAVTNGTSSTETIPQSDVPWSAAGMRPPTTVEEGVGAPGCSVQPQTTAHTTQSHTPHKRPHHTTGRF